MSSGLRRKGEHLNGHWYFICLAVVVAVAFRFYFGPLDAGTFIDEYRHIFAAKGINDVGLISYLNGATSFTYRRGLIVSVLVSYFFHFFGENLFAARLVPFFAGLGVLLVLYLIGRKVTDIKTTGVFLFILAMEPWIVWTHTYIREYIFVQFFFYGSILAIMGLWSQFDRGKMKFWWNKRTVFWVGLLIIFLFLWWFGTKSKNGWIIFPFLGISLLFFWFEWLSKKIFGGKAKRIHYILLSASICVIVLISLQYETIQVKLFGTDFWGSSGPLFYIFFLLDDFRFWLLLFLVGSLLSFSRNDMVKLYLLTILIGLSILHQLAPFRQMRFVVYLMPIFFLFAAHGLVNLVCSFKNTLRKNIKRNLENLRDELPKVNLSSIITYSALALIPLLIISPPQLYIFMRCPQPGRGGSWQRCTLTYMEWEKATDYLREHSSEDDVIITSLPEALEFEGLKPDFMLLDTGGYIPEREEKTGTKNIRSLEMFREVIENAESTWIVTSPFLNTKISERCWEIIEEEFSLIKKSEEWIGIEVYLLKT